MFRNCKVHQQPAILIQAAICAAVMICVATKTSQAFPVDFVLSEPDQKSPSADKDQGGQATKEAKVQKKAEPAKPRKGIVREKAAVVAAGAAEAAEEVGQVLGNIIGGIFGGGRDAAVQAQMVKPDANALKQFEAQYGRHFDQVVRTELHFIRIVCQPTRQQYEALAADGKLVRKKAISKFAALQQGMNRGINGSNDSDTRKPVIEGLLISARRHLSADQVAIYERELAAKKAAYRNVTVLVTASKLDRKLVLSSDQRAQVTKVLDDNWNPSWGSTGMLMYGGQYFPDVPDAKLTPIFTETQRKVWRTVNQQNQIFWGFNIGMNQGIAIPDEQWNEEPVKEAPGKTEATSPALKGNNSEAEPAKNAGGAKPEVIPAEDSE